jgi:hypothetical protein
MARQHIAAQGTRFLCRCVVAAAWAAACFAATAADSFTARLTTVPIDSVTAASTTGTGKAAAVLDGTRLTLSGEFAGLQGAATVARIHEGAVTGVRGPAVRDFAVPSAPNGAFTAELTLTPDEVESLRQGRLYIQIHSASAPDGNLWGWLLD